MKFCGSASSISTVSEQQVSLWRCSSRVWLSRVDLWLSAWLCSVCSPAVRSDPPERFWARSASGLSAWIRCPPPKADAPLVTTVTAALFGAGSARVPDSGEGGVDLRHAGLF